MNMRLPDSFSTTIQNVFKEDGRKFLSVLPSLIEEVSQRWGLTDVQPVPNLSYNFVAFAKRPSTALPIGRSAQDVVLKLGIPNPELASEISALKLFDGEGACRLLECDEEKGFLLLERLNPGTMLAELEDDDQRTQIAVDVMQKMVLSSRGGGTPPLQDKFIQLSDWFNALKRIRPHFNGGTGPIPKQLLERVESFLPELFAAPSVLLHGDFHHFNILKSERGWLVIDPKGVIGPAGYEIGPLMLNPWIQPMDSAQFKVHAERRVDIIHERTGWAREKIINWALAHSILSACWDLELESMYSIGAAKIFSSLK